MNRLTGLVLAVVLAAAAPLAAGDTEHWGEYGVQMKLNDRWSVKSDVQFRIREDISDFYWFRYEVGPTVKFYDGWVNLTVLFRVKPQEYGDEWRRQYNIFVDPVFKLAHNGTTTFDIRTRVHTQLNDQGREFIRIRPRLTHRFFIRKMRCAWIAWNDLWFQLSDLGPRDRYNVNWLGSGVKFGLNRPLDLTIYLQYRSDKLPGGDWDHDPVIGTSLMYKF